MSRIIPSHSRAVAAGLACLLAASTVHAEWLTYRGDSRRTGNVDGSAGPKRPHVLWVHRSREQYVASPVATGERVYVSGLGAFNTAVFHALNAQPAASRRAAWSKRPPALKLPVVSSPALVDGKLLFGDGMHQTDGAALHCLRADTGGPIWRLDVPGKLVHIEGGPTVAGGRAYVGAGEAGVLCVELNRVTLDGKEQTLEAVQALLARRWKELQARYEEDKKKDPDFAIPPSEDALPRPSPKLVWHQGQGRWHVDAPLAVVGDRVLLASSYLDREKTGDRALYCVTAAHGKKLWRTPLLLNPWAGPSVDGETVLIGLSSIRFDPKTVSGAKGRVMAFNLADGTARWSEALPGGVLSPVAIKDKLAVVTSTDGKVRALDAGSGKERWSYDAGSPMFAGAAVAGDVAYVADLRGMVHAVKLADGSPLWTLNLAAKPVKAGGMVYGSPTVGAGRLFVATCNFGLPGLSGETVVVCIGEK